MEYSRLGREKRIFGILLVSFHDPLLGISNEEVRAKTFLQRTLDLFLVAPEFFFEQYFTITKQPLMRWVMNMTIDMLDIA